MIITIKEARKLIGKGDAEYTDQEIEEIIYTFTALSDVAIDSWLTKSPDERKEFIKKITQKDIKRVT
jgi:ABC-type iron transport system FetAB ATPase subunit